MIKITLVGAAAWLAGGLPAAVADGDYIDLADHLRRQEIREFEHQQRLNESSRVLRVSGKLRAIAGPLKRVRAV